MSAFNYEAHRIRPGERAWHCGVKSCTRDSTHKCSYDYLTGLDPRQSTVVLDRCLEHATRYARKHHIRITA